MEPVINEAIQKTISAIETIAPRAWELLVRSERVDGCVDLAMALLGGTGAIIASFRLYQFVLRGKGGVDGVLDDETPIRIFALVALAAAFIIGASLLGEIPKDVARIAAPEVYAARALIEKASR